MWLCILHFVFLKLASWSLPTKRWGKSLKIIGFRKSGRGPGALCSIWFFYFSVVSLFVSCTTFKIKPKSLCNWQSFLYSVKIFSRSALVAPPPFNPQPEIALCGRTPGGELKPKHVELYVIDLLAICYLWFDDYMTATMQHTKSTWTTQSKDSIPHNAPRPRRCLTSQYRNFAGSYTKLVWHSTQSAAIAPADTRKDSKLNLHKKEKVNERTRATRSPPPRTTCSCITKRCCTVWQWARIQCHVCFSALLHS